MSFSCAKCSLWLILCICLLGSFSVGAAEFVINSKIDAADAKAGDGRCETSIGDCTLRAAIEESNALVGADTILFVSQSTATDNYKLGIADLRITDDLTIRAVGVKDADGNYTSINNSRVVISGEEKYGILIQQSTPQAASPVVLIENLTIKDGKPDTVGSLIRNTKSITTLSNIELQNGGAGSRAIYNDDGSFEIIKKSRLAGNDAALQSNKGSLRLDDVTIENNTWTGDAGGAAIYLTSVSSFLVKNSTFKGNRLTILDTKGGAIHAIDSNLVIDNSNFEENTTLGAGGAIYTVSSSLRVVNGSSFLMNRSANSGGGIYAEMADGNQLIVENTTFSENKATVSGGGLFVSAQAESSVSFLMQHTEVSENEARYGAGLYLDNLNVSIVNSTLSENISISDGGGIYLTSGTSVLQFVTIAKNKSFPDSGGNIFNASADLSIQNSIVADAIDGRNCSGVITSLGNNIDSEDSCTFDHVNDFVNTDPLLYIDENEEPKPKFFSLVENSPAIDTALCIPEIIIDQIYNTRASDCDIGAYEDGSKRIDSGKISFIQSTYAVNEADGSVEISLRRSEGSEGAVSVLVRDIGFGNAKADATVEQNLGDYVYFGEALISWGDNDFENKSLNITLIDNTEPDGDKTIFLELVHPTSGAALGSVTTAVVNITDEEYISRVRFARSEYEFKEDSGIVTLTLNRVFAPKKEVEVEVEVVTAIGENAATETAEYSADYNFLQGQMFTVTFGVDEMSKDVEIDVIDDVLFELTEYFTVTLKNKLNAIVVPEESEILISILDDDMPIQTGEVSFVTRNFKVNEFDKSLEIPISRSNGSDGVVRVSVTVTGGEERELSDYVTFESIVEFKHGEEQSILRLNIIDNNIFEKNLRLKFNLELLKKNTDAKVTGRTATVEIIENDVARFRGGVTEETRSVGAIYLLPVFFMLLLIQRILYFRSASIIKIMD